MFISYSLVAISIYGAKISIRSSLSYILKSFITLFVNIRFHYNTKILKCLFSLSLDLTVNVSTKCVLLVGLVLLISAS